MRYYDLDALEDDDWGLGEPPPLTHRGGGIESHFDPRMGREILQMILEGQTVRQIADLEGMPCTATIYQWVKMHTDFRWRWEGARRHLARERMAAIDAREKARLFWPAHMAKVDGKRWWRRGRPSSYSRRKALAFCRRVARGETLMQITSRPEMPSMKVIYTWLKREPEFREVYAMAREHWILRLQLQEMESMDAELEGPMTRRRLVAARRETDKIRARIGRMRAKTWRGDALR